MNGSDSQLPLEYREAIDRLADEFERAYRAGQKPRIEDYLQQRPELRGPLLAELLAAEIELRRKGGERVASDDYRSRFPDDLEIVATAMPSDMAETVDHDSLASADEEEPQPDHLGRYAVERELGRGGFGVVYLAHDPQLDRSVAIKRPRKKRFESADAVAHFIEEARKTAKLKHPNLIAVYDVQQEDGLPFIVQEYVEGTNLGSWAHENRPSFNQIVRVLTDVADAVGYLHQESLTHCDLKLANVLVDQDGTPYVADFGLAVHENAQAQCKGAVFGTPALMAPEQVRGEGHRLDGRTDIWAMGAMLYELLCGRKPFSAMDRDELYDQILKLDPKPPRQVNRSIPRELERICLKCLSKPRTGRYATADDLRDDLRAWLEEKSDALSKSGVEHAAVTEDSYSSQPPPRIIPKGLRSFSEEDSDFFLDLLPGPRDRDGLPESIRFWKNRIEETNGEKTFSVGLIYGPSGCGKSSLVRAGLLPRLGNEVADVYVEATTNDTEERILKQLRERLPRLSVNASLSEACAEIRRTGGGRTRKVLLVIDQFEQWLHSHPELKSSELVDALRQCDGGRLQVILLVRDDFFASVHRLFQELEDSLLEGRNYALVDRFDKDHARQVLAAFGRAYGKLNAVILPEQQSFLDSAVEEVAEENRVVSVRLALFAEMMKARPWLPQSLAAVGGVSGVGVTFLQETFDARTAPPSHRVHHRAIRGVLGRLLPEVGTDIKGAMQSADRLRESSGYGDNVRQFDEVIGILDGELRIITPTEPGDDESASGVGAESTRYYQLTHDYLVPALRTWLVRKQAETVRGRARLRLEQRALVWESRNENRYLPSFGEFLRISALTSSQEWNEAQSKMMKRSRRYYSVASAAFVAIMLAVLSGAWLVRERLEQSRVQAAMEATVDRLMVAEAGEILSIVSELQQSPELARPSLIRISEAPDRTDSERLRALMALAEHPGKHAQELIQGSLHCEQDLFEIASLRVRPYVFLMADELWRNADREDVDAIGLCRLGALLAVADPENEKWMQLGPRLAGMLVKLQLDDAGALAALLEPVSPLLVAGLREHFFDSASSARMRQVATELLARFAEPDLLVEALLHATPAEYARLIDGAGRQAEEVCAILQATLAASAEKQVDASSDAAPLKRNAMIATLQLGKAESIQSQLAMQRDPTVRTAVILNIKDYDVPAAVVLDALRACDDAVARQSLLLALGAYTETDMPSDTWIVATNHCRDRIRNSPYQSERSAAQWLLREWNVATNDAAKEDASEPMPPSAQRDWWRTAEGQTMRTIRGPSVFTVGSPKGEYGRAPEEDLRAVTLEYTFAVSAREITVEQYQRFQRAIGQNRTGGGGEEPACRMTFGDALRYCRWLSEREGVSNDQMCYSEEDLAAAESFLSAKYRQRTGYRLLTELEWELVCRAGSETAWFCGADMNYLPQFAWFVASSSNRVHSTGALRPNQFGIFDLSGNVAEWCHAETKNSKYPARGGGYRSFSSGIRSASRYEQSPNGYSFIGFRIARTLDANLPASGREDRSS